MINRCMRYSEIANQLLEDSVMSSWISDLTLNSGSSGNVTMALGNGKRYSIKNLGNQMFRAWLSAPSKGKFWHERIKARYRVERLI